MKRLCLIIHGKVHDVFFRDTTVEEAQNLSLTGWVRNNPDGTVEAVFEGTEENLKKILEFCNQGPSEAEVKKVDVQWEEFTGEFNGFLII